MITKTRKSSRNLFFVVAILAAGLLSVAPGFNKAAQASSCKPNQIICAPIQDKSQYFIPGPYAVDTYYGINSVFIPITNPAQFSEIVLGGQVIFKYYNVGNHTYSERLLTFDNGGLYFYNIFGITGLAVSAHNLNISYTLGEECPAGYRCSDDPPSNPATLLVQDKTGKTLATLLVPFWTFDPVSNSLTAQKVLG